MKQIKPKKLALNVETLRRLNAGDLEQAVGGGEKSVRLCTILCATAKTNCAQASCGCKDTWNCSLTCDEVPLGARG